uniref:Putative secreted protein n=1 Tax=Anopheles triannulatus TaxID=58253 RepID=A0A2M4B627_9DIPT
MASRFFAFAFAFAVTMDRGELEAAPTTAATEAGSSHFSRELQDRSPEKHINQLASSVPKTVRPVCVTSSERERSRECCSLIRDDWHGFMALALVSMRVLNGSQKSRPVNSWKGENSSQNLLRRVFAERISLKHAGT